MMGDRPAHVAYNDNLAHLRDIAKKLAAENKQPFANVHDAMYETMKKAQEALGSKYDGLRRRRLSSRPQRPAHHGLCLPEGARRGWQHRRDHGRYEGEGDGRRPATRCARQGGHADRARKHPLAVLLRRGRQVGRQHPQHHAVSCRSTRT